MKYEKGCTEKVQPKTILFVLTRRIINFSKFKQIPGKPLSTVVAETHIFPFYGDITTGTDGVTAFVGEQQKLSYGKRNPVGHSGKQRGLTLRCRCLLQRHSEAPLENQSDLGRRTQGTKQVLPHYSRSCRDLNQRKYAKP